MAVRKHRKLAMLHKVEATYGEDSTPAVVDALVAANVTITPIEGQEVSRDLLLPYMGNQGIVLAGIYGRVEFDIEVAGSGAAGTPPKIGSILRVAGMSETITAGQDVTYEIVEEAVESGSLYFISDKVRHVLLGGQANIAPSFTPSAIPRFRVTYLGLLGTITDVAVMPAVTTAEWITPDTVSKANTTMSLHGWPSVAESLSIDLGNVLTPRFLIGDERILISDRSSTGTTVVEGRALSEVDWFDRALKRTRGELTLTHGKTAGNIVEITAPAVEVGKPTQGQTDGIINYSLPLSFCPVTGMDELKLVFR
ncbi:phage tail tube protein [Ochrobactrum chromiisoli]|uniref:Phage tail tube protein n=1 Tax=Ochrobactrum chromiisoli TaxID=2993941 RepID=A0ABT3QN85_9HYPH|nr:phage tail tube protein [Ochrobactrum chromiisoli]MCX2697072.1 phage tail tube protein [Ochrobactrum chromiisoli]